MTSETPTSRSVSEASGRQRAMKSRQIRFLAATSTRSPMLPGATAS
jgi:hypothetical protein